MKGKAIVWTNKATVEVKEVEFPSPGPGQLLLENRFSLVSPATEYEWLTSDASHMAVIGKTFPFVPGYSFAGYVKEVGKGVSGFKEGDAVICAAVSGAHASYDIADPTFCFHVPDNVRLDDVVFFNLAMTAIHTARLAEVTIGDTVAIIGQGPIGRMALQACQARGAKTVIACDILEERRQIALRLGADMVLDTGNQEAVKNFLAINGGVDKAIDLSASNAGMNIAIQMTKPLGKVVFSTAASGLQPISYDEFFIKGLTIVSAFVNARLTEQFQDTGLFLWMLSKNRIQVPDHNNEIFTPEEAPEVYKRILERDRSLIAPIFKWNQ